MLTDTAVCTCHGVPALLDTNQKLAFWLCEIDDKVCEVRFGND